MTDKELIKEEIERRYNCEKCYPLDREANVAAAVLQELLLFIDSLPEEPASENKSEKELSETYLATFDKKYPILPTLKGKQKADFKNFLNKCQQEFGLKEFGIHPTQSKLFEKLTLLWATWGAEHLGGLGESNEYEFDKEPISEDLEEAAKVFSFNFPSELFHSLQTQHERKLWKDEIEQAYIYGGEDSLQNQWISVEEALPPLTQESGQVYLTIDKNGCADVKARNIDGWSSSRGWCSTERITHWMCIPSLEGGEK